MPSPVVNTLELAVWKQGDPTQLLPPLTRFMLPMEAQRIIVDATRLATNRGSDPTYPLLKGLSEILAWFAPDLSFMKIDRIPGDWDSGPRLMLFMLGEPPDGAVKQRLRAGLAQWMHIAYDEVPRIDHAGVVDAPLDDENWKTTHVSPVAARRGACPIPEDGLLFDTLIATAAGALRGAKVTLGDRQRVLVNKVRRRSGLQGLELVVHPPILAERDRLWSEVVTLTTATFPEQDGVHVIARSSLRNWGPVNRSQGRGEPTRALDVFMPRDDGVGHSHVTFDITARRDGGPDTPVRGWWSHQEQRRVFELLQRLTGNTRLTDQEITKPYHDGDLWVLPRLTPGNGDRFMSGGTGVGWQDRASIADALSTALSNAGFAKADDMTRVKARPKRAQQSPFVKLHTTAQEDPGREAERLEDLAELQAARRAAILKVLRAQSPPSDTLDVLVLHIRETTPLLVESQLLQYLGQPTARTPILRWEDGLQIRLVMGSAGTFAEALPDVQPSDEERSRFTPAQLAGVMSERRADRDADVLAGMRAHAQRLRGDQVNLGGAVVEMAKNLMDSRRDPYALGRHALACEGLLPQVILDDEEVDESNKHGAAIRDILRMLGVVPLPGTTMAPCAMTILQANRAYQGGKRRESVALPAAIRVREGILECALPDALGEPEWMPYFKAVVTVLQGTIHKFERTRTQENKQRYENFFGRVLEDIDVAGPALVVVEAAKIRHKVAAFQNARLEFDVLRLGNQVLTPAHLPEVRIVRMGSSAGEQPFHFHRSDTAWPSGVFRWGGQTRTAYSMKKKPQTVKRAIRRSRHAADARASEVSAPRVHPTLDEVCVIFQPPGDDATATAVEFHRLREMHAQYDSSTRAPFPLHELQLLSRGFSPYRASEAEDEADDGV